MTGVSGASGAALRGLYLRLLQGWNDRDAKAMAECFSGEGVMIGFDGSLATGRAAIERHLAPIFADHPTARFVTIIRSIRERSGSGILRADVGMVPPDAAEINPAANARQVIVAAENEGCWAIELFQNTLAALHLDEPAREGLSAELNAVLKERGPLPPG